jgi:hypothetical protein
MLKVAGRTLGLSLCSTLLLIVAATASSETLREALAAKHLPLDATNLVNLDRNITSGAQLDDADQFVIAYYIDNGMNGLNPPLYLDRFDRKQGVWKSATLAEAQSESQGFEVPCLGSILGITAIGNRFYLDTHINPSAGCTLVLSREMKVEASLYGWLLGRLDTDTIVYHRSQIHFAPVHPAEIAVYNLRSKRDVALFPPKSDTPLRLARTEQLKAFYKGNEEWCNKNNDPCDPAYFDSALEGKVASNETEQALAFVISYEQIQYVQGDVQKPSGPKDVLYVYRGVGSEATMEYREVLLSEAKARFGERALEGLLQPEMLGKIFSDVPPKKP